MKIDLKKLDIEKPKFVADPIEKSPWIPGPSQWKHPLRSHMRTMWTLFSISTALLVIWLVGLATGYLLNGWIHAFIAGAIVMCGVSIWYGFKYCEYLERPPLRKIRSKFRRPGKETIPDEHARPAGGGRK